MWQVWIHYGKNEWKMILRTDSYRHAEDTLLDAYVHRAEDFISIAMYDQFDNRHMYINTYGEIEQLCRTNWNNEIKRNG